MCGLTAIRELRRREALAGARTPLHVIALTANSSQEHKGEATAAGASGFLSKPIWPEVRVSAPPGCLRALLGCLLSVLWASSLCGWGSVLTLAALNPPCGTRAIYQHARGPSCASAGDAGGAGAPQGEPGQAHGLTAHPAGRVGARLRVASGHRIRAGRLRCPAGRPVLSLAPATPVPQERGRGASLFFYFCAWLTRQKKRTRPFFGVPSFGPNVCNTGN